jgi:hypothetical protein
MCSKNAALADDNNKKINILAEVFDAQPSDMEEMIQRRLEEGSWYRQVDECF